MNDSDTDTRAAAWEVVWLSVGALSIGVAFLCVVTIAHPFLRRSTVAIAFFVIGCAVQRYIEGRVTRSQYELRGCGPPPVKTGAKVSQEEVDERWRMMVADRSGPVLVAFIQWALVGAVMIWSLYYGGPDKVSVGWAAAGYAVSSVAWLLTHI